MEWIVIALNTLCFVLMGQDKARARQGKWRIPERTLFLSAACFGAVGGTLGMYYFHHKTRHWYFKLFFPMMAVVQIALLAGGGVQF